MQSTEARGWHVGGFSKGQPSHEPPLSSKTDKISEKKLPETAKKRKRHEKMLRADTSRALAMAVLFSSFTYINSLNPVMMPPVEQQFCVAEAQGGATAQRWQSGDWPQAAWIQSSDP